MTILRRRRSSAALTPTITRAGDAALHARFDALGPWFTEHVIDGVGYGGTHNYAADGRIPLFFEWLGEPQRIIELSSYEAGHSLMLSRPEFVTELIGVEGRPENIARAELAVELLGRGTIRFVQRDLDQDPLGDLGRADAVFCAGLLYHLLRPWRLLDEIAAVTDRLLLDTHYAANAEAESEGHPGCWFQEGGYDDTLSGLSPQSFWMTRDALLGHLRGHGYEITAMHDHPDWAGRGPRIILAAVRGG